MQESGQLFTLHEFHLQTTLWWIFLWIIPTVQIIPADETVLLLPKRCSFLEREIGQRYIAVFQSLRLHGLISSTFYRVFVI
ncbi:LOW QUALITY PROTEIN: BTB/POZ domain-containing protein 16 [Theristicus caerulescens]